MKVLNLNNFSIGHLFLQLVARLEMFMLPMLRKISRPAQMANDSKIKKVARARLQKQIRSQPNVRITPQRMRGHRIHTVHAPKKTLFQLKAPAARSVKLVADFTDWEKYPLNMIQCEGGLWAAIVPLTPGNYLYRFIVDGRWQDDPLAPQREPNPFGTANAIVEII